MNFFSLVFLAIIIEGVISYTKTFFVDGKFQWQTITAIAAGILVSIAYQVDLFATAGLVSQIPYIGSILTGILISRGSNYIFDLIKMIQNIVDNKSIINVVEKGLAEIKGQEDIK